MPPLLDNLKQFGPDDERHSMIAKFKYAVYYAGVLSSNAIPANFSLEAIDLRWS